MSANVRLPDSAHRRHAKPGMSVPRDAYAASAGCSPVGCTIYDMESFFEKFRKLVKPFLALWNSARVTCVAVGIPLERKSVATRIVLQPEELPKGAPFRQATWLEPTAHVLVVVMDFPKAIASQVLFKAIEKYQVDLENSSTLDRVLLKWALSDAERARQSDFNWYEPKQYGRAAAKEFGEDRTCLALIGSGGCIGEVMPDELRQEIISKLHLNPPHFDGVEGLYETLLPGVRARFLEL